MNIERVPGLVESGVCWLCRRHEAFYRVTVEGHMRVICETCWLRVDDDRRNGREGLGGLPDA